MTPELPWQWLQNGVMTSSSQTEVTNWIIRSMQENQWDYLINAMSVAECWTWCSNVDTQNPSSFRLKRNHAVHMLKQGYPTGDLALTEDWRVLGLKSVPGCGPIGRISILRTLNMGCWQGLGSDGLNIKRSEPTVWCLEGVIQCFSYWLE